MQRNNADRILAIFALSLLAAGCLLVLWPFLTALVWAAILASTSWPAFLWLDGRTGQRRVLTASLMTLLVMLVLLGPVVVVATVLTDDIAELGRAATAIFKEGLPDAPDWLRDLPLVGPTLHEYWQRFAHNGDRLIVELQKLSDPAQKAALAAGRVIGR
ncbi:MAG: AI-2E family transporter, partial [Betaproteobacteria bacterium]|nr:AI-2E family transporter [Betaproteobacteria bacterium]